MTRPNSCANAAVRTQAGRVQIANFKPIKPPAQAKFHFDGRLFLRLNQVPTEGILSQFHLLKFSRKILGKRCINKKFNTSPTSLFFL
ncbi:hypothetical protein GcM3_208021 [Golovinomyces cichoracearum]|uniref:Uncharacterized protein n=1 Tax=Golovinomyces cichoracearum TaxID=62708 RepID=A0A420HAL4_9PEZI|nr:hypothetical protein GcM3_208021 [Golovinomyces cichoracearum]